MIVFYLPAWITPASFNFFIAGLVGLFANFSNMRARGYIEGSLYRYLFVTRPGWTLSTILTLLAADAAATAIGGLDGMKLSAVCAAGFTSGWAIDAACDHIQHPPALPTVPTVPGP